jgi:hypothetical protein
LGSSNPSFSNSNAIQTGWEQTHKINDGQRQHPQRHRLRRKDDVDKDIGITDNGMGDSKDSGMGETTDTGMGETAATGKNAEADGIGENTPVVLSANGGGSNDANAQANRNDEKTAAGTNDAKESNGEVNGEESANGASDSATLSTPSTMLQVTEPSTSHTNTATITFISSTSVTNTATSATTATETTSSSVTVATTITKTTKTTTSTLTTLAQGKAYSSAPASYCTSRFKLQLTITDVGVLAIFLALSPPRPPLSLTEEICSFSLTAINFRFCMSHCL